MRLSPLQAHRTLDAAASAACGCPRRTAVNGRSSTATTSMGSTPCISRPTARRCWATAMGSGTSTSARTSRSTSISTSGDAPRPRVRPGGSRSARHKPGSPPGARPREGRLPGPSRPRPRLRIQTGPSARPQRAPGERSRFRSQSCMSTGSRKRCLRSGLRKKVAMADSRRLGILPRRITRSPRRQCYLGGRLCNRPIRRSVVVRGGLP